MNDANEKCYALVCSCNGMNLKAYTDLGYYFEIGRKLKPSGLFKSNNKKM